MGRVKIKYYVYLNILTLISFFVMFNPSVDALTYPFIYDGDGLDILRRLKMIINGSWSILGVPETTELSKPFGFILGDFPSPNFTSLFIIKLFSFFIKDAFILFNVLFIATYLLAANGMYYVLSKLRINILLSITIAILFAFAPFHFLRMGHFMYLFYFAIPIQILYVLRLWNKKPLFFIVRDDSLKYKVDMSRRNFSIALVIFFSSLLNFYYTFFISFLVIIATFSSCLYHKNKCHLISGLIFIVLLVAPFSINMIPYKLYEYEHGGNSSVAQRVPAEAEIYGLKISQMLLPISEHRISTFSDIKARTKHNPLTNENGMAALGLTAALGFLFLVSYLLIINNKFDIYRRLSILNVSAVLLATIGGFSSVFATLVTPQIRGYNRISIVITAISLIAVALLLNHLIKKNKSKALAVFIASALLVMGLLDQVSQKMTLQPTKEFKDKFNRDAEFIESLESALNGIKEPKVLQLPYMSFPESPRINKMNSYSQMVHYLHSDNIGWTYGAVKGRESDRWLISLTDLPIEGMLSVLKKSGFNGVLITRSGYEDDGEELISKLSDILGGKFITNMDNTEVFFEIIPTGNEIVHFPSVQISNFWYWEGEVGSFGWSKGNSNLYFDLGNGGREILFSFELGSFFEQELNVTFNGKNTQCKIKRGDRCSVEGVVTVGNDNVGKVKIKSNESGRSPNGGDVRKMTYYIKNLQYKYN